MVTRALGTEAIEKHAFPSTHLSLSDPFCRLFSDLCRFLCMKRSCEFSLKWSSWKRSTSQRWQKNIWKTYLLLNYKMTARFCFNSSCNASSSIDILLQIEPVLGNIHNINGNIMHVSEAVSKIRREPFIQDLPVLCWAWTYLTVQFGCYLRRLLETTYVLFSPV